MLPAPAAASGAAGVAAAAAAAGVPAAAPPDAAAPVVPPSCPGRLCFAITMWPWPACPAPLWLEGSICTWKVVLCTPCNGRYMRGEYHGSNRGRVQSMCRYLVVAPCVGQATSTSDNQEHDGELCQSLLLHEIRGPLSYAHDAATASCQGESWSIASAVGQGVVAESGGLASLRTNDMLLGLVVRCVNLEHSKSAQRKLPSRQGICSRGR